MGTPARLLILFALLIPLAAPRLRAQGPVPDRTRNVAPGVIHSEYTLPGPLTFDVLEVSLTNPLIRLETYRPNGLTRTTLQSAANDRDGHRVIGAVNADFFSFETGWPVGNQIANGKFVLGVSSSRSHFALDAGNRPLIERLAFRGRIVAAGGAAATVNTLNQERGPETMVFFTTYRGSSTLTDAEGVECAVRFVGTPPMADTLFAVVTAKGSAGNMAIPADGGVISGGTGTPASFLAGNTNVGDTIKVFLGFNSPIRRLTEALGGAGRILMNGRNVSDSMAAVEGIGTAFTGARHPRTFFAFNRDSTKAYLCTVDGRQASSIGATFADMASFLLSIGAWDGFNFDGGGSTTMVVRGEVVNSPSDPAGERSVANSLHVISTALVGTLTYLDVQPALAEAFQGGTTVQFSASGTDEYYNPIALPPGATWEADGNIGTIDQTGLFTALGVNDSGWIRIRWNAVVDSALVIVRTLTRLYLLPPAINMVPGEQVMVQVRGRDSEGNLALVPGRMVNFSSSHPSLNVDAAGLCTATDFGGGTLTADLQGLQLSIPFNHTGNDTTILLEGFDDVFLWDQILRTNCDSLQASVNQSSVAAFVAPPGAAIQYNIPSLPASLQWVTSLPLSGRPDSLILSVYGCGNGDSLQLYIEDKDGDPFLLPAIGRVTWNGEWRDVGFRLNRAVSLTGRSLDYPFAVRRLVVHFHNLSGTAQGTLLVDGIRAHYPLRVVTPQVLFDFEAANIDGWQLPTSNSTAQMIGIIYAQSKFQASSEVAYQGSYCGKWTFVDDSASAVDWDVRITRRSNFDLGSMLRGSYIGAWVYANGNAEYHLQTVIRGGNGQICAGPVFPVNHVGWKLIGTRLEESLFSPYLTSGIITDANNKYNGFRVRAANATVHGKTKEVYIDKLVTSALTVPSGYHTFSATWNAPLARLHWSVNSEISISRYSVERGIGGVYGAIGALQATGNSDTVIQYEYVDTPPAGTVYQYRIRQITNDGAQEVSPVIEVNTIAAGVGPEGSTVREYELMQNYPNPFNPATTLSYAVPRKSQVVITIRNILGQTVENREVGTVDSGVHQEVWIPRVASGVYFYTIRATAQDGSGVEFRNTKRMLLVK